MRLTADIRSRFPSLVLRKGLEVWMSAAEFNNVQRGDVGAISGEDLGECETESTHSMGS